MNEREQLVNKIKYLTQVNKNKQIQCQQESACGPECGFLTKEALVIASLLPAMRDFNITLEEIDHD